MPSNAADKLSIGEVVGFVQLMLAVDGISSVIEYKDVDGFGNTWVVIVTSSTKSDMDTLASVLVQSENLDHQIPSKTHHVLARINNRIYSISMLELRRCMEGVGIAGFACAKQHIRIG